MTRIPAPDRVPSQLLRVPHHDPPPSDGTRLPRWLGLRACLALCLGLSLALAGCGDSSNDKGSEGQSRNLRCAPEPAPPRLVHAVPEFTP
jgi:hypothetical protein